MERPNGPAKPPGSALQVEDIGAGAGRFRVEPSFKGHQFVVVAPGHELGEGSVYAATAQPWPGLVVAFPGEKQIPKLATFGPKLNAVEALEALGYRVLGD